MIILQKAFEINSVNNIVAIWTPNDKIGFLPSVMPSTPLELSRSNSSSIKLVSESASNLGVMTNRELEDLVSALSNEPEVDPEDTDPALCEAILRAYVCIAAHLIHRPGFVQRKELPAPIARPIFAFSKYVKRPPSLTYASYVLANFATPIPPRTHPSEIKVAQTLTGTKDEKWFIAVHLAAESVGAEVVSAINIMAAAFPKDNSELLVSALESIESSIEFANSIFSTVIGNIDPEIFRNSVRPYLFGHSDIKFKGVSGEPNVTYVGETGAQSGMMRAVDIALGTRHSNKTSSFFKHFSLCAPPPHQKYFKQSLKIGQDLLFFSNKNKAVKSARRAALLSVAKFRRSHLDIVNYFLVSNGRKLTETGTGGTDFINWLGNLAEETEEDAAA